MKTLPLAFLVVLLSVILSSGSQVIAQCEPGLDCNANGTADSCDIADNTSSDCDGNGVPDECQIALLPSLDCNQDQILDACEGILEDLLTAAEQGVNFGSSSDISGDRMAIGAPDGTSAGVITGAVYMYRNTGSRWVQETTIVPPDSTASALFGWSVDIDGDLLIVGSPGATGGSLGQNGGAAYIYRHDGTNWIFEVKLEASNGVSNDEFGISVGVSGERAVVGAWRALAGVAPGSAYIFSNNGLSWNQDQIIESNDPTAAKRFGGAVAIDGNTIAVSDQRSDLGFLQQVGGVFLYTSISQTSWLFTQKVTAQDPQEGAQFGRSLDLSGDQLLIGAPITDGQDGATYLFDRAGFVFSQSQKFSMPAISNGQLGNDVAISGEVLISGSWRANGSTGILYLHQPDGVGGYTTSAFTPINALEGDRFGWSVAADGRWVVGTSSSTEFAVIDRMIDAPDCNSNGIDDPCDIFQATSQDCDLDGIPDACQIASGVSSDCDLDGIPDHCEIADGTELDCNLNDVIDTCDIAAGTIQDCNTNGIPDDCESDCNLNNIADECELSSGTATDCNANGILDSCDLQFGFAIDCNANQIPDSCDIANGTADDCNNNNALDICEITIGIADDCNLNLLIDQCELDAGLTEDCNFNSVPDICDIAYGLSMDCNGNMNPDECELMTGEQQDCNQNGTIDACELLAGSSFDCDSNGTPDECDLSGGALDCNGNAIPDSCEVNADPNPPVISGLPVEVLVTADLQGCSAVATWDPAVITDDCGISSSFSTHTSGSVFAVGSTAVLVSATDVSGNTTDHLFNVIVLDDQLPILSNVPNNISVENDPGLCTAQVIWAEPLTADNCLSVTLVSDHNSGDAFPVGTTLVTYTATDGNGNIKQDFFEVTVQDVDLPSIVGLPGSVIVNSNPGLCTALVSWASPSIEDNCPGSTFSSDHQPGDLFPVGTTQINYLATDTNGNTSAATFDLTVVDSEMPVVSGIPNTVTLPNDSGSCGATHSWATPTVTDNCGNPVMTSSHNSGDQFPIGSTTVSIHIDDGHGNTLDFTFDVIIFDTELPVISGMPVSMTLSNSPGLCSQSIDWALPTVSDNCSGSELVGSALSGSSFPVGDTEVIYTANDIHGNIIQESFIISVIDDELPVLIGIPSNMTVDSTPDVCGSVVAWSDPQASDNCGTSQFTTSHAPGSTFDVGTTTVTYEVTDVNGNLASQSFDVTVLDVQQPAIADMPQDILLTNELGSCTAAASWNLPTASDNCSVSTLLSDRQSGEQFDVGTTTVTYTATDASGLQSVASFQVIVEDTELPTIDGLIPAVTVTNIAGSCEALATWAAPTSTDNCGSPTLVSTHEPGWLFTVGDTVVTYTATDLHGNQTSAQIIVSVLDEELPIISAAPVEIALSSEPGQCSAAATWTEPTVTDNCEVQLVETSHVSGTIFPVGTTLVTYTATDIHSNSSQHSFSVIVSDMELPQILDLPATVEIPAELDMCSAMATWVAPTASDNCEILDLLSSHAPGDTFPVGTTTVTLTATDVHANSATAAFDVVVTDTQAPLLVQMPADIQLNSEAGLCSALASWIDPTGEDNCGIEGLATSHLSGTAFDVGTTDVIFTLTDINGNETQATMLVTVSDVEAPQITNLPERTTVETVAGTCEGTTSWIDPDTADNCGVASLETDIASGAILPVGETVVTYTVTDLSGNTSSQSFIVTVADQELPVLSGVPSDMVIPTDLGLCSATAPWTAPTAQDNCGIDTLVASHQPGEALPKGVTEVSITATDIHGNVQTESFLVTVHDDENPEIENMPLDITITAENGLCGATVTWTAPTADDNCDSVILTSTHQPGEFFAVGTTEVTYTASDDDDNTSSASFLITITDDEAPALLGLSSDLSLPAEAGLCSAAAMWAAPTTSDNCQVSTLTSTHSPGDVFVVGSTEVSYTVSDIHGNETTASFLVTVSDQQAPQFIGLPERVTVPSEAGLCTAVVSWSAPTATDNCEVAGITLTHASGDQFPVGDTQVDLTATDIHGNETLTSFIVTVEDLESPLILDTPADIALANDAGSCGAVASWIDATATDNCGIDTLTSSHTSGDFFDVGTTEVTITALDIHGNSSTSSYSVTITDNEDPTIDSMPADMTLSAEAGLCSSVASWVAPTSSDNCEVAGMISTHLPGDSFAVGTTEVTYTSTDIHGNELSASFLVTVTDDQLPTIIGMPASMTLGTEVGLCSSSASWVAPESGDNCGVATLTSTHQPGEVFLEGLTEVTYTLTDIHGNSTSESFTITVEDLESPLILDTPADIALANDAGSCGAVASWIDATASDNCGIDTLTSSRTSGDFFDVGTTEVTITALDIHGNSSTSSYSVTITDNEDPTIASMPADMTLSAEGDHCDAVVSWGAPTSSDNCEVAGMTSTHLPGDVFPVGTTEVTYTSTDIHGNATSESFLVTITDDQDPTIDGLPSSMTIASEAGLCSSTLDWVAPGSDDNCGVDTLTSTHQPGGSFPVGATEVTYTATDIHGNSNSESFTVTVEDLESPLILDTPADIALANDAGSCGAVASWIDATASDNCGIDTLTSSHTSGDFFDVGTTEVTISALDIHGNSSTSSYSVTITDNEDPTIASMPADMTLSAEAGLCSSVAGWVAPTSSDNCEVAGMTSSHLPGDSFAVGTTEVTYTSTDIHGNATSASVFITVTDDEAPMISGLPADFSVSTEAGLCSAAASWSEPTISDNCEVAGSTSTSASGDTFSLGTTEVTYSVTDIHGNESTDSFLVTVTDDEYPVILGIPADISISSDLGLCGASVSWVSATTTDNCSVQVLEETHTPGDYFPVGTTPVTYASTDASGNRTLGSFNVTVIDTEDPQISGLPTGIEVSNDTGNCGAAVTWPAPSASDNCDTVQLDLDHVSGEVFPVGISTVIATATDQYGNSSQSSFEVVVNDNESPQIFGTPANISLTNDSGQCGAIASWADPSAADNCGSVSIQVSHDSGDQFPVGQTTVLILATDLYGNTTSSVFSVLVEDTENPQVIGTPSSMTLSNDPGQCGAVATWAAPSSTDNCSGHSINLSHQSGDSFPVGTTQVQVIAKDAAGNASSTTFDVTVLDEENPTLEPSADITEGAIAASCNSVITVPAPATADNCQVASVTNDQNGTSDASGVYELGTTIVTWTVTDIHGNEASASQSVTVTVDETDCNANGLPDVCEIGSGTALDCNTNGIPDECELDCNGNGTPDDCDIASGGSLDTNDNGTPDECEQQFNRGDANATGTVDVTDPIYILQYVIGSGPAPSCMDAGDCNDDESLDLSDAIYLLQHLFMASAPPAAPYGNCGIDPDGQSIGCDSFSICP